MSNPRKMQVQLVDTTQIKTHPENKRRGDIETIKQGLTTYDQYAPLVVQKSTGHVLVGNHRFLAACELGWTKINVIYVDVDDDEARRRLLFDNRVSDKGEYDEEGLLQLLREMDGLDGTGYEQTDVDELARVTGALGDEQASFLDGYTGDGTSNDDDTRRRGQDERSHFQLGWPVTKEQRELVMDALKKRRERDGLETTVDALVALARDELARGDAQLSVLPGGDESDQS